jgi:hypothetical protein
MNDPHNNPSVVKSTTFSLKPIPKILNVPAVTSGAALINDNTITKPIALIDGVLHKGTKGVLAGSSKAGKTWLLLYIALCVATGTRFLRFDTTKCKIFYANLEILTAFMKERLVALMKHLGIADSGDLDFWNLRGKFTDLETLIACIIKEAEGKGYGLIIIDPIYKLMGGKSENTSGGVAVLCNQLERLAELTGAAVLYAHHFAKGNAKKKTAIDRLSGSGVFTRDADSIITLTEHSEPDCYTVEMVLRNFPKQDSFVVQWDYPIMVERQDLDPEDVAIENVEDEDDHGMMDILKPRPHTTAEWQVKSMALGISRATFFRIKRKLKDGGCVEFNYQSKTWSAAKSTGTDGEISETRETDDILAVSELGPSTETIIPHKT